MNKCLFTGYLIFRPQLTHKFPDAPARCQLAINAYHPRSRHWDRVNLIAYGDVADYIHRASAKAGDRVAVSAKLSNRNEIHGGRPRRVNRFIVESIEFIEWNKDTHKQVNELPD